MLSSVFMDLVVRPQVSLAALTLPHGPP